MAGQLEHHPSRSLSPFHQTIQPFCAANRTTEHLVSCDKEFSAHALRQIFATADSNSFLLRPKDTVTGAICMKSQLSGVLILNPSA